MEKIKHKLTASQLVAVHKSIQGISTEVDTSNPSYTMAACLFTEVQLLIAKRCVDIKGKNTIPFSVAQAVAFNLVMRHYTRSMQPYENNVIIKVISDNDRYIQNLSGRSFWNNHG